MYKATVSAEFNSAHRLGNYNGKCEALHGHNWKVEATVAKDTLNETGMVIDFVKLRKELALIADKLDHSFLNEVKPFDTINPTSENIAKYIFDVLKERMQKNNVKLIKISIWETPGSCASYEEE